MSCKHKQFIWLDVSSSCYFLISESNEYWSGEPILEDFILGELTESHWWWHYPNKSNGELTQTA
jgi:hypothetical protein